MEELKSLEQMQYVIVMMADEYASFRRLLHALSVKEQEIIIPLLKQEKDYYALAEEAGVTVPVVRRKANDFKATKDLYVYILNIENASNNTTARIDWNVVFGLGDDAPWFSEEIPVLFISTANPYHLFDAPMAKTFINAYHFNPNQAASVMNKIMGRSEFTGISPVDPFCGKEYLKF